MGKILKTDIQIRFADVDSLGHVNNANMQHYFDLGKMDFYNKVLGQSLDWKHEAMVLVSIHIDYRQQTRLDDPIYVETAIEKIGNKSMTFLQRLFNRCTGNMHAECRTVAVGFDYFHQKSIELLPVWRKAMEEYLIG